MPQFASFRECYSCYLQQPTNRTLRRLHMAGTLLLEVRSGSRAW